MQVRSQISEEPQEGWLITKARADAHRLSDFTWDSQDLGRVSSQGKIQAVPPQVPQQTHSSHLSASTLLYSPNQTKGSASRKSKTIACDAKLRLQTKRIDQQNWSSQTWREKADVSWRDQLHKEVFSIVRLQCQGQKPTGWLRAHLYRVPFSHCDCVCRERPWTLQHLRQSHKRWIVRRPSQHTAKEKWHEATSDIYGLTQGSLRQDPCQGAILEAEHHLDPKYFLLARV